jgi:molybdopterin converting factor small subunit
MNPRGAAGPSPGSLPEVTIRLPHRLRPLAGEQKTVAAHGRTVGEVLDDLMHRYPELRSRLREAGGALRTHTLFFLNSEDIRAHAGESTPVADGDVLAIVPVAEGG